MTQFEILEFLQKKRKWMNESEITKDMNKLSAPMLTRLRRHKKFNKMYEDLEIKKAKNSNGHLVHWYRIK